MDDARAEADLIARCRRGDAAAWDQLFDRHYAPTGRFLFQLSPGFSAEEVEELCQEVFLAVVRNLPHFHGGSRLQTWIFRIALNKARDHRERLHAAKRGGGRPPLSLDAEDPQTGLRPDPPADTPGPDGEVAQREEFAALHAALAELGAPCREIIELRYFGDLSYEELSAELKLNPKTVSSRLSKCLDKLEALLQARKSREQTGVFPSNPL